MLEPKGFNRPEEDNAVNEPERRRLIRSENTEDARAEVLMLNGVAQVVWGR
jgi:hypothetical protein